MVLFHILRYTKMNASSMNITYITLYVRRKIAIVLVEEKPQSNNSNASLLKEQQYQSAYDQLSAIVLSIIEVCIGLLDRSGYQ